MTNTSLPHQRTLAAGYYLAGIVAVVIYGCVVYANARNIPKWDDFPDILQFLDHWLAAGSVDEKFSVLVSQTNEHILLFNHLIILCQYYAIGHLNFAWLIYLGNLVYLGSALVLWLFFRNAGQRAFCFAIAMLTGASFYPYESTLWAMTALSNQAVILFSLLAIYAITRKTASLAATMLCAAVAVSSQSNGLLLLPVIGFYLAVTRNKTPFAAWCIFSAVLCILYAHWFNPASQQGSSFIALLRQLPVQNFVMTLPTFFASLGSAVFTQPDTLAELLAVLGGAMIFVLICLQAIRRQYGFPLALVLGFLLLSLVSLAAYRGLVGGLAVAFVSRYKMYGTYVLAAGVLLGPSMQAKYHTSLRWQGCALAVAILYFAWSFPANLPQSRLIDGDLYRSLQQWVEDGDLRRARGFFVPDADSFLFTAIRNGTYSPLALIPERQILRQVETRDACPAQDAMTHIANADAAVTITHRNPNAIGIKVTVHPNVPHTPDPVVVTLCSEQHNYRFTVPALTTNAVTPREAVFYIPREKIAAGKYAIRLDMDGQAVVPDAAFINKPATR